LCDRKSPEADYHQLEAEEPVWRLVAVGERLVNIGDDLVAEHLKPLVSKSALIIAKTVFAVLLL
jgi:hypothetical protein